MSADLETRPKCRYCIHPEHSGMCTGRNGGTANVCPCIHSSCGTRETPMTKLADDIATLRDLVYDADFGDVRNERPETPALRRLYDALSALASLTPEQARALAAWMSESAAARERAALTDREYAASFREEGNEARARDYDQQEADELAIAGPRRIASTIFSRLGES